MLHVGGEAFLASGVAFEIVPAYSPVAVVSWVAGHVATLLEACATDDAVRPQSGAWWVARAKIRLALGPPRPRGPPTDDLGAELRAFLAQRGW
jgi:hypothetical protein